MRLDQVFGIVLTAGITLGIWKLNRLYERSGTIFAVPFNISRARTPGFFRVTMILNWIVFTMTAAFAAFLSTVIIASWL